MSGSTARRVRASLHVPTFRQPSQVVVLGFASAIAVGTVLLLLPVSRAGEGSAPFMVAVFTATSAVCVTGLVVVDTPSYWSAFGELVILGLIQLGGLGIMAAASLLGLLVSRRMGLRYLRGFYDVGERTRLYVTPGVGFSGVTWRTGDGTSAEVAVFTLRVDDAALQAA